MTLNELIENSEKAWTNEFHYADEWIEDALNMLQKQSEEIADLKIANQDLKYQLIQKSGEQVLIDFKELIDENNDNFRKEQVEKFYAEAKPLSEKYKLRELTDKEIKHLILKFFNMDSDAEFTDDIWVKLEDLFHFAKHLKKASEK